jgi:ankyrin repeat protein
LELGADPDAPGREGRPPLLEAARTGQHDAAQRLIAAGADVNEPAVESGNTALMFAANRGDYDMVRLLLEAGASTKPVAKDGWTAFEAAEMIGEDAILTLLREAEAKE